jgi:hypothetical protein
MELKFIVVNENDDKVDEWVIYSDIVPRAREFIRTGLGYQYIVLYVEYNHVVEEKKVSSVNIIVEKVGRRVIDV